MKGFREKPQGSKNDIIRSLQVEVQNLQMALKMTQMLTKRMLEDNQNMGKDIGGTMGQLTELQYQFGALTKTLNLDSAQLVATANEKRLSDFNETASKADQSENLTPSDVVTEESTVTLTSTTDDGPDSGIFRSRVKLTETGVPALQKGLLGQPVGTKIDVELGGKVHHIELLSIMVPIPTLQVAPDVAQAEATPTLN